MSKILITGANRGIGLELCRQLVSRGDEVIAVCRKASAELQSLSLRVIEGVDVSDADSISSWDVISGSSLRVRRLMPVKSRGSTVNKLSTKKR